jgi:hypothetical protein
MGERALRKLIVIIVIVAGSYSYLTWKPSASEIAGEMRIGDEISYRGEKYTSDWGGRTEKIEGYLRRMDRHFDKSMPIITYDLVLTSGEYNDPDIVNLRHKGGGNYYWSSKKKPEGSLLVVHTVPATRAVQDKLDRIEQGASITLSGRISQDSEIKTASGGFLKLVHSNHKFILVEDAGAR